MPLQQIEAFVIEKLGPYRRNVKALVLWLADMILFTITLPLALYVRLDFNPPYDYISLLWNKYLLLGALCYTFTSFILKTYSTIIRLANLNSALRIAMASALGTAVFYISATFIFKFD
ncbi:MAG: hypothetical protein EOP04_29095, partial [Proteobacteria bacterium]